MPEGPEIYALSLSLNLARIPSQSYGKHVFIRDSLEDWTFGLSGKVILDCNQKLTKRRGYISGSIKHADSLDALIQKNKLGIDWMTASQSDLEHIITSWRDSRKKLGALLLDQSQISGIGVAWGSEALHIAKLRPDVSARDQDLKKLAPALIKIRNEIKKIYTEIIEESDPLEFVNNWFDNLYNVRKMKVYKVGTPVEVAGRKWWI